MERKCDSKMSFFTYLFDLEYFQALFRILMNFYFDIIGNPIVIFVSLIIVFVTDSYDTEKLY